MKQNAKGMLFYIIFIVAVIAGVMMVMSGMQGEAKTFDDLTAMIKDGKVIAYKWDQYGNELIVVDTEGNKQTFGAITTYIYDEYIKPAVDEVNEKIATGEITIRDKNKQPIDKILIDLAEQETVPFWISFLPYIILIGVVILIFVFARKQAGGKDGVRGFGKARAKLGSEEKNKIFFKDVAGCDEEKEELTEIVEFLRDPGKFTKLGAKIPHGVLLVGPPGTGKTLLAKAVAGEAGVPFYSISGSDFVEMYVGVGASRVRDLFETARRHPASIVFIDEIDAVGRHRGAGLGGGHDEREQTLNQLLVEMDGFGGNTGIIVMAATNRPDILDPALLRPGRFDRQVTVNYPTQKGREEILKVHSRNKPLEKTVDLARIAQMTSGFTGADLANVLNEAALLAARKRKNLIGMNDVEEAVLKVMVGTSKKTMRMNEKEKRNTAYHEAGHALMDYYLETQNPVRRISIIPSSKGALGYTLSHPSEDKYSVYRRELQEQIASLLGGRVAEELINDGDFSGGASNDIQRATGIARNMVTRYGMSSLGPILYGSEHGNDEIFLGRDFSADKTYSEETAAKIDAEIKKIVDEAYALAKKTISEHFDKLKFVAEFLVKYEEMDDVQFKTAMETEEPTFEQIDALIEEKRALSRKENEEKAKFDEAERKKREEELMKREDYRRTMRDVNVPSDEEPDSEDQSNK